MRLSDFLEFAREKDLYGIMITIAVCEKFIAFVLMTTFISSTFVCSNYYCKFISQLIPMSFLQYSTFYDNEDPVFDTIGAVIRALDDAGYNKQTSQRVMIQSSVSSYLVKFKEETNYDRVYMIVGSNYWDIEPSALPALKKFATAVSVPTDSITIEVNSFTANQTSLVRTLQNAGLPVYVYELVNEYDTQPLDFFADATVQIVAYVQGVGVDGILTDFPATARRYKCKYTLICKAYFPVLF